MTTAERKAISVICPDIQQKRYLRIMFEMHRLNFPIVWLVNMRRLKDMKEMVRKVHISRYYIVSDLAYCLSPLTLCKGSCMKIYIFLNF